MKFVAPLFVMSGLHDDWWIKFKFHFPKKQSEIYVKNIVDSIIVKSLLAKDIQSLEKNEDAYKYTGKSIIRRYIYNAAYNKQ